MKFLYFLITTCLIFNNLSLAQMNPDGYLGGVSIHVQPYLDYGSGDYFNFGTKFREFDLPTTFGVKFILNVPIAKNATIGGFFNWSQFEEDFITDVSSQINSKGDRFKLGMTFSLYTGG